MRPLPLIALTFSLLGLVAGGAVAATNPNPKANPNPSPATPAAPGGKVSVNVNANANVNGTGPTSGNGSPYSAILSRNAFGLVPIPPPVDPATLNPPAPPVKITVNGIMTIFGKLQAAFKVAQPGAGGQPAKDVSYCMSEGERQDDISVEKIDEKAGTVTFNNHNIVQILELSKASGGAPGGVPAPGGGIPGVPQARPMPTLAPATANVSPTATTTIGFGGRFGRKSANANAADANAAGGAPAAPTAGAATTAPANQTPAQTLSPEEQIISMEQQRAKWLDEGNPAAAIMPPTPITKQVTGEEEIPNPPVPGKR